MNKIQVDGQIFRKTKPDLKIFSKDGVEIKASEIILSSEGEVLTVIQEDGTEFARDTFDICSQFLEVPGVGFLKPQSIVRIKGQEYVLNYGSHVNISNQHLISWYLTPHGAEIRPDPLGRMTSEDRTLYLEMIDEIDLVTV